MTFTEALLPEMLARRVTRRELAARLGRHPNVVAGWLRGDHQPPAEVVPEIAAAMDVVLLAGAGGWHALPVVRPNGAGEVADGLLRDMEQEAER